MEEGVGWRCLRDNRRVLVSLTGNIVDVNGLYRRFSSSEPDPQIRAVH